MWTENSYAFTKVNVYVWTGPECELCLPEAIVTRIDKGIRKYKKLIRKVWQQHCPKRSWRRPDDLRSSYTKSGTVLMYFGLLNFNLL